MKYFIIFAFFACAFAAKTALHRAVEVGDVENIEKCICEDGIGVNEQDKEGETALHLAVLYRNSQDDVIQTLLETEDIDITIKDKDGQTPLHRAVFFNKHFMVRRLINKARKLSDILVPDGEGKTPLDLAEELVLHYIRASPYFV